MKSIYLQNLVRLAWVAVVLAVGAPVVLRHVQGQGALLRWIRARCKPVLPIDREELQDEMGAGVRVALLIAVLLVALGGWLAGGKWWLVGVLAAAVLAPTVMIPISVVHTAVLRLLAFRGPVVSTAVGITLGEIAAAIVRKPDYHNVLIVLGGVYGLMVGLRRLMRTRLPGWKPADRDAGAPAE